MNVNARLRKLEAERRQNRPPCTLCSGDSDRRRAVVVVYDDEEPNVQPCPGCGREPLVIRVVYCTQPPLRQPREPTATRASQ